jgi:hypothetical protein
MRFRKMLSPRIAVLVALGAILCIAVGAESASANVPGWSIRQVVVPKNLPPGGTGEIVVIATNLGGAPASGSVNPMIVRDELPAGVEATSVYERTWLLGGGFGCEVLSGGAAIRCEGTGEIDPYEYVEVHIAVSVKKTPESEVINKFDVSGGGAEPAFGSGKLSLSSAPTGFGIENFEQLAFNEDGSPDVQAGSHPYGFTTTLQFNEIEEPSNNHNPSPAPVKDLHFDLPPGLIGNPTVIPQCTFEQFSQLVPNTIKGVDRCPDDTAVGVATVWFGFEFQLTAPVFNITPAAGEPARFAFDVLGVPVFLDTAILSGGDYAVQVNVNNISTVLPYSATQVTLWGARSDPSHDQARGWNCISGGIFSEEQLGPCPLTPPGAVAPPFLTLPTSCTGPLSSTVEADSWTHPGEFALKEYTWEDNGRALGMGGCNKLRFEPSVKVTPDATAASAPTGVTVDEHVPQESTLNPSGLAESDVEGLSVTLPEGVALNPAAADGLQACTEEEIGLHENKVPSCPESSKVATVKVKTPLLPDPLEGAMYLATQDANPFGSLVALYLYAEDPTAGVIVKAAGEVLENPVTGQLTTHFERDPAFAGSSVSSEFLPQLAFEDIELHFFGGDRAPLAAPSRCGAYTTTGTFTPWSGNPTTESNSTFAITSGPNGSPCPGAALPFSPSLTAGTTSIQAGGFSPFTMTMSREDGAQNLQSIELHMPPGLSGTLSKVQLCGEAQADQGTCGPESEIGETIISVGVGGDPFSVTGGKVYITGPYKGAPFGLSIVNPAKAGPFDLGKVVVRAKIEVDPITSALTITSDNEGPYKIPSIIDGIPLQIKHVNVTINRPGFTFNPTNCSPMAITGNLRSTEGTSSALSVPFQVTNCATLAFRPHLSASTSGKTSRQNGASLTVKLGYTAGPYDANIAKVKVELPKALPSRLSTLQKACLAATFEANPANCPAASIVGQATATTPIVPVPLSGPAYFVSHGGEAFPSLIIVLQGYGVTVHLVGSTFISKAGITSSTFKTIPDVPVGTFELTLPEEPGSALAANGNLCEQKLTMPTELVGQNGAEIHQDTSIAVTGCKPSIRIVSHSGKGAAVTVVATVPSAGRLVASGSGFVRASKRVGGAGKVAIRIALSKAERELLARHPGRRLTSRVRLSFKPKHGAALTQSVVVLVR